MLIDKEKLLLVPLESMNETHFEEVEIVNSLYPLLNNDTDKELILKKLNEFYEHTVSHFSGEEELMQKYSFFAYGCHKNAHDLALERIQELIENYKNDSNIDALKTYFDTELIQWLSSHIATMDTVTGGYLKQNM